MRKDGTYAEKVEGNMKMNGERERGKNEPFQAKSCDRTDRKELNKKKKYERVKKEGGSAETGVTDRQSEEVKTRRGER